MCIGHTENKEEIKKLYKKKMDCCKLYSLDTAAMSKSWVG